MAGNERAERRLKLQELRVLMSVVETGSMSKAAKALSTSQPAVSRAIADLEHSLGVRLLDRDRNGITLTPYGEVLLKRSVAAFDELRLGVRDIRTLADPESGEVRVAAQISLANGFIPEVIGQLGRRYPRMVCRLKTDEPAGVFRKLKDREVDVAIAYKIPSVDAASLDTEMLFPTNPLVVVAGMKNPISRRRNVTLADLMNEPWAVTQPEGEFSFNHIFRSAGVEPPVPAVIADSIPTRLLLAAGGRFLTIMSEPMLRFAGQGLALKVLPVRFVLGRYDVVVATVKNRTLTTAARIFIDCARDVAKLAASQRPREPRRRTS